MKTNKGGRRTRSSWRVYLAIALAVPLAGCATQSPPLSELATVGGPPKGMARIVVLRGEQTSLTARYRDFPIKLDGEPLGDLGVGSFAYLDRPGGSHQLSAEICCIPGVTRRDFMAASGRTYYFKASVNEKATGVIVAMVVSPVAGAVAGSSTYNDRQGPIDLTPISESDAKHAIAAMQQTH
jgi:hypothetical protein